MRLIINQSINKKYSWRIDHDNDDVLCFGELLWDTPEEARKEFDATLKGMKEVENQKAEIEKW